MATIKPAAIAVNDDAVRITWTPVTENDTCGAYTGASHYDDRSIQVTGTFGGSTTALHGSNDGSNFSALSDAFGVSIGLSSAGIKQVMEYTYSFKPVPSGGTGQSLTMTVLAKKRR